MSRALRVLALSMVLMASAPLAARPFVIRNVAVVDVGSGRISTGREIVVDGRNIVSVRAVRPQAEDGVPVVDGGGRYVIPGLWDMGNFVLNGMRGYVPGGMELLLAHGVVGTRSLDTEMPLAEIAALEKSISEGRQPGPKLIWTGRALHQSFEPPRASFVRVETPEDVRAEVEAMARAGAHYVRLGYGFRETGFCNVVAVARSHHLPVSAWVVSGYADAVASGIASIDHFVDLYRSTARKPERDIYLSYYRDEALRKAHFGNKQQAYTFIETLRPLRDERYYRSTLKAVARAKVPITSNMATMFWAQELFKERLPARARYAAAEPPAGPPPANAATAQSGQEIRADFLDIYRAGIPIIAGTGSGDGVRGLPGETLHDELELMVLAGLTPRQALASATTTPAAIIRRLFPRVRASARVAPSSPADFVLLDRNPLEDIRNTRSIYAVVSDGRWYGPAERAELLRTAEDKARTADAGAKH